MFQRKIRNMRGNTTCHVTCFTQPCWKSVANTAATARNLWKTVDIRGTTKAVLQAVVAECHESENIAESFFDRHECCSARLGSCSLGYAAKAQVLQQSLLFSLLPPSTFEALFPGIWLWLPPKTGASGQLRLLCLFPPLYSGLIAV